MHASADSVDKVEEGNPCSCEGEGRGVYTRGEEATVELEDVGEDVGCAVGVEMGLNGGFECAFDCCCEFEEASK